MKKWIVGCMMALGLAGGALASSGGITLDKAPNRTNDVAALQNGAKLFVNYCLSCHSAAFARYNRMHDIGLNDKQIKENLNFTSDKVGDLMKAAINPRQAKEWFGANPPDLTVIARAKASNSGTGADYLYTYLRTYYRDDTKATGWNNLAFPSVAMPNVLWELQGERKPVFQKVESHGHETEVHKGWEQVKPGAMTPAEFDHAVGDLVAYMQWMGEPQQNNRVRIGVWVLIFLGVLVIVTWRLNAAFWKSVK